MFEYCLGALDQREEVKPHLPLELLPVPLIIQSLPPTLPNQTLRELIIGLLHLRLDESFRAEQARSLPNDCRECERCSEDDRKEDDGQAVGRKGVREEEVG